MIYSAEQMAVRSHGEEWCYLIKADDAPEADIQLDETERTGQILRSPTHCQELIPLITILS